MVLLLRVTRASRDVRARAQAVGVYRFWRDSGFVLGDGVWEGMRVHRGRISLLDRTLQHARATAHDAVERRGAGRHLPDDVQLNAGRGKGTPNVLVDPYDGKVVAAQRPNRGWGNWLRQLHVHKAVAEAQSSQCPRCSSYISLRDYQINEPWNRRIQTRGDVLIDKSGVVSGIRKPAAGTRA